MRRGVSLERAEELVRRRLHGSRLEHTFGVRRLAARLARVHGVALEPVEFAALLHDWAKEASEGEFRQGVESGAVQIDPESREMPQLHGCPRQGHEVKSRASRPLRYRDSRAPDDRAARRIRGRLRLAKNPDGRTGR